MVFERSSIPDQFMRTPPKARLSHALTAGQLDLIDDSPGPVEIAVEHGSRPTVEPGFHRRLLSNSSTSGQKGDFVNGP